MSGRTVVLPPDPAPSVRRLDCPTCGGPLGEPFSEDVHCFVACGQCGSRFELDDPRLIPPSLPG